MYIIPREEWAHRPPRNAPSGKKQEHLVVHWPGPLWPGVVDDSELQSYLDYHMDTKGWSYIAYNWAIGRNGDLFELRGNDFQNAANSPANSSTQSVLFLGVGEDRPQPHHDQIITFGDLVYEMGYTTISPHKDVSSSGTACPGPWLTIFARSYTLNYVHGPYPGTPRAGNNKNIIAAWQAALNEYRNADLVTDGLWGPKTAAAYNTTVEAYGKTDQALWDALPNPPVAEGPDVAVLEEMIKALTDKLDAIKGIVND